MNLDSTTSANITLEGALLAGQVFLIGLALSFIVRWLVRRILQWRNRGQSASRVFSKLAQWVIILLSFMASVTVVFPSVRPVDILGGITIISIAAGIAFQTVLGSMFAGFVILARDRYRIGDQISVQNVRGEVVSIEATSTSVRTFDGRLVVLPNTVLHDGIVTVQTGYEKVRSSITIALNESTDLSLARSVAVEALHSVPSIHSTPAPEAHLVSVGAATVDLEVRFWSGARQLDTVEARSAAIESLLAAFNSQGVLTGSDAVVIESGPILKSVLEGVGTPEAPPKSKATGNIPQDPTDESGSTSTDEPRGQF